MITGNVPIMLEEYVRAAPLDHWDITLMRKYVNGPDPVMAGDILRWLGKIMDGEQ